MAESSDSPEPSRGASATPERIEAQNVFARRAPNDPLFAHIVYGLYAASFIGVAVLPEFFSLMWIAGLIVAYLKRVKARGFWLETHYTWQIRTFWYSLLILIVTVLIAMWLMKSTSVSESEFLILLPSAIWELYRIIKGWIWLVESRGMYPLAVSAQGRRTHPAP